MNTSSTIVIFMNHISVHCVDVLLLLLFCCPVKRKCSTKPSKLWRTCICIVMFRKAITVSTEFVVENTDIWADGGGEKTSLNPMDILQTCSLCHFMR